MTRSRFALPVLFALLTLTAAPASALADGRHGDRPVQHRSGHREDGRRGGHGDHRGRGGDRWDRGGYYGRGADDVRVVVVGPRVVVSHRYVPSRTVVVRPDLRWEVLPYRTFLSVRDAVARAPFSDEKLAIIRDVSRDWLLTTGQAIELAALLPFSGDRVDALAVMHGSVVDPENFWSAYDLLVFSSDREALRRRIGGR